jgi:hypothetical protein
MCDIGFLKLCCHRLAQCAFIGALNLGRDRPPKVVTGHDGTTNPVNNRIGGGHSPIVALTVSSLRTLSTELHVRKDGVLRREVLLDSFGIRTVE